MASEIRVNSLSSRAGLSTVTFTDTGPIFSGITTFQDNSGFNVGTGGSIFSPASNTVTLGTNNAERLRITSDGKVAIGFNAPAVAGLSLANSSTSLGFEFDTASGFAGGPTIRGYHRPSTAYKSLGITGADIKFGINDVEKLRLDSNGYLGLNNSAPHNQYYNNLVIGDGSASGDKGITIRTQSSNEGVIAFSDADSGAARYAGKIAYNHGTNAMMFFTTNGDERLRITSGGNVNIKGGNLFVGLDSATLDFTDSNSNTKFVEVGANGGDALFVAHSSGYGVGYFGYEAGGDRLVVACDNGSGANKIDFIVNATTFTGGSTDNLNNVSPALRITSGGDLLLGGQTAYTYDDTGASNTILDIANSANNKRGILSLSGNTNANGPSIGTIWFNNDQNSGTGPGATMKLAAAIQAKAVTSDSNAGDDSGAYLQFLTKPESAALAESMVIHSDGEVIKSKQPGFFTRRAVGGDGRSGGAQEWSVSGTGSFNTGSNFNASNGRFTAPIAGRYLFTACPGYKQSGQDYNFYFRINGTDASEGCRFVDGGDDLVSHSTGTSTVIYNLSANDYVDVYVGQTHHVNLTYNFFMGYLLG